MLGRPRERLMQIRRGFFMVTFWNGVGRPFRASDLQHEYKSALETKQIKAIQGYACTCICYISHTEDYSE